MSELAVLFFSLTGQQTGVLAYLLFIAGNTLLNWRSLPRLGKASPPDEWPPVAVLVPARNEAHNIRRCVQSLLAQDYPDFQVWVLDDDSQDETPAILAELAAANHRLHIRHSTTLPPGWLGKTWACQQLAEGVPERFRLLLFVDADTWHTPDMLRAAVAALEAGPNDLLSVLPRQIARSLAEVLTVPILPWALLSHFPLWLTRRRRWPQLAAAVGQFMLWRRDAYRAVGGHVTVRTEVTEDMALARLAARQGLRVALVPGPDHVFCRMYRTVGETIAGFGKNLFSVFERRLLTHAFVWLWLGIVFLSPWVLLLGSLLAGWPASPWLAGLSIAAALPSWGLVTHMAGLRRRVVLLYPFIVFVNLLLAFYSMAQTLTRRAQWKGRPTDLSVSEREIL